MQFPCWTCAVPSNLFCAKCKQAHYCSKECQRADWKLHKEICGSMPIPQLARVIITDIPGKGKGMRAGEEIKQNTAFFVEEAALGFPYVDGASYILQAVHVLKQGVVRGDYFQFLKLLREYFPKDPQHPVVEQVWAMTYSIRQAAIKATWRAEDLRLLEDMLKSKEGIFKLTVAKLRLNCFFTTMVTGTMTCCYDKGCLLNHSCRPNAAYVIDKKGNFGLISERDIAKGEEITVSYSSKWNTLSFYERRQSIRLSYFFNVSVSYVWNKQQPALKNKPHQLHFYASYESCGGGRM